MSALLPPSSPSPWLHGDEAGPVTDPDRIAEIARLRLDEMEGDAATLAALRELAASFGLPSAFVSLVLDGAQTFLAGHGLSGWMAEAGGVPVEWSFCRFPVAGCVPFVVEDAESHPLVQDNPVVRHDGVRCYAGAPLVTSNGVAVGAVCVTGPSPRQFTEAEIARLEWSAAAMMAHLEHLAAG